MQNHNWITLCHQDELIADAGVCALLTDAAQGEAQQIALFRLDEQQVYALANWDPVGQANVLYRGLVGEHQGELFVASPLYKQRFSLSTGRCLDDEALAVARYPVRIVDSQVQVHAG